MLVSLTTSTVFAGGSFNVTWMQLGPEACNEDIVPYMRTTTFYDIFNTTQPLDDVSCPAGYTPVKTGKSLECLAVKEGMELLASRFETRRCGAFRVDAVSSC